MQLKTDVFKFSASTRKSLADLGLSSCQMSEIERTLPVVSAYLEKSPTVTAVKTELQDANNALLASAKTIKRLMHAPARERAVIEARNRAITSIGECDSDDEVFSKLLTLADAASVVLSNAIAALPRQRRSDAGSCYPIERIDRAIMKGLIAVKAGKDRTTPKFNYKLRPSSNPTSNFRQIIGLCYDAIGQRNNDPERAIKAYVARQKVLQSAGRDRIRNQVAGTSGGKSD